MFSCLPSFQNPLTRNCHFLESLPLSVDWALSIGISILRYPHDTLWRGGSHEEQAFIQKFKARSIKLWDAAVCLNPKFASVPLELKIINTHQGDPILSLGHAHIRVSQQLIEATLRDSRLDEEQKLAMLSVLMAHEMGHTLLRHNPSTFQFNMVLSAAVSLFSLLSHPQSLIEHYVTRRQEREADQAAVLILAAFNKLVQEGAIQDQCLDLGSAARLWTHFMHLPIKHPFLLTPFTSHPPRSERATLSAQMAWILCHHPDVLTNATKRNAFFRETRPLTDPQFLLDWNLPIDELSGVLARTHLSSELQASEAPSPAERGYRLSFIEGGQLAQTFEMRCSELWQAALTSCPSFQGAQTVKVSLQHTTSDAPVRLSSSSSTLHISIPTSTLSDSLTPQDQLDYIDSLVAYQMALFVSQSTCTEMPAARVWQVAFISVSLTLFVRKRLYAQPLRKLYYPGLTPLARASIGLSYGATSWFFASQGARLINTLLAPSRVKNETNRISSCILRKYTRNQQTGG